VYSFYIRDSVAAQSEFNTPLRTAFLRERIDLQKMKRELDPDSNLFDKRKIYRRRKHTTQHPKQSTRRGSLYENSAQIVEPGARARDAISHRHPYPSIACCCCLWDEFSLSLCSGADTYIKVDFAMLACD
jgi:hypothetical protein